MQGELPHVIGHWASSAQPPDTFTVELSSGPVPHLFGTCQRVPGT